MSQDGQGRFRHMTRILLHGFLSIALSAGLQNPFVFHHTHGLRVDLPISHDQAIAQALVSITGNGGKKLLPYYANPIGVPINPESYVAAWQKGASLQEMHKRSYAGEFAEGASMITID
jgi:hypothetical protein